MIYVALLAVASIAFSLIAWRDQKIAIFLILATLPSYLLRFHVGPVPMTLLEVFVLVLCLISVIKTSSRNRLRQAFCNTPFHLPIILFCAAAIIGTIVSPDALAALGILKAYFAEPILFFFLAKSALTRNDAEPALKALGVGALAVSVLGVIQWITHIGIPAPWDIEGRIVSVFAFPNAVGLYLGPIVTMAVIMLTKTKKIFWLTIVVLGIAAIFAAETEGAYVAIPASLLLVSFFVPHIRRMTIPLTVIGLVAAFTIAPVREKLTLHDYSGEVRRTQWSETIAMLKDHPITGAGLSGYETTFAPYHQTEWVEIFAYPHNIILNTWSELGILGLIAFILLAWQTLRLIDPTKQTPSPITLALFAALLEMTIHGLVDVPYFKNDLSLMTWTILALLVLSSDKKTT